MICNEECNLSNPCSLPHMTYFVARKCQLLWHMLQLAFIPRLIPSSWSSSLLLSLSLC